MQLGHSSEGVTKPIGLLLGEGIADTLDARVAGVSFPHAQQLTSG
jgi:hypothetical protein